MKNDGQRAFTHAHHQTHVPVATEKDILVIPDIKNITDTIAARSCQMRKTLFFNRESAPDKFQ